MNWSLIGMASSAYLVTGRPGTIVAGLLLGLRTEMVILLVTIIDFVQIPLIHLMLVLSSRHIGPLMKFERWTKEKVARIETNPRIKKIMQHKDLGFGIISALPVKGCGILSAYLLAYYMSKDRIRAALFIMLGSVISSIVMILLFNGGINLIKK